MNKLEIIQIITLMLEVYSGETGEINNYFEIIINILLGEFTAVDRLGYKINLIQNVSLFVSYYRSACA